MHSIPYATERRADTGVTNGTLGIWLFLASEVMLFGALFSSYALLRVSAEHWPVGRQVISLPLGLTNTAILAAMTWLAWRARRAPRGMARKLLAFSSLAAVAFLAVKGVEWQREISHGLLPATSTFLAMYYALTGLHALHVVCGLAANGWAIAGRVGDAVFAGRTHALSLYWMFVDLVWLTIFVLLYLT
jgi:heme/copper-type cytochrome/quinol oxidase subunit 3